MLDVLASSILNESIKPKDNHNWDSVGVTDSNFNKFPRLRSSSSSSSRALFALGSIQIFHSGHRRMHPEWAKNEHNFSGIALLSWLAAPCNEWKDQKRRREKSDVAADTKSFAPCVYLACSPSLFCKSNGVIYWKIESLFPSEEAEEIGDGEGGKRSRASWSPKTLLSPRLPQSFIASNLCLGLLDDEADLVEKANWKERKLADSCHETSMTLGLGSSLEKVAGEAVQLGSLSAAELPPSIHSLWTSLRGWKLPSLSLPLSSKIHGRPSSPSAPLLPALTGWLLAIIRVRSYKMLALCKPITMDSNCSPNSIPFPIVAREDRKKTVQPQSSNAFLKQIHVIIGIASEIFMNTRTAESRRAERTFDDEKIDCGKVFPRLASSDCFLLRFSSLLVFFVFPSLRVVLERKRALGQSKRQMGWRFVQNYRR
jgi:hypothetical protein